MLAFILPLLLTATPVTTDLPPPSCDAKLLIDELKMLDDLIKLTEENVKNQKHLRDLVFKYKRELSLYLKNSSDKETVLKVAKTAHLVLEEIKCNHLLEAFQPDFISELTLFSQIALKKGIPKP